MLIILENEMNIEKALSIVSTRTPCGHHDIDTNLGDGKQWAKCEGCGETFRQSNIDAFREQESDFNEAMDAIRKALKDNNAIHSDSERRAVLEGIEDHSPSSSYPCRQSLAVEMPQGTICCVHDAIETALLDGDTVTTRHLLRKARHMAERMECRLLRYRRGIEVLGFTRDNG